MITQAYEYDLPQAYPSIILDVLKIDIPELQRIRHDKQKRSIFIGKLFKKYPELYKRVRMICDTIVYCYENELTDDDILLTKVDGFISTKPLSDPTCCILPISLKYRYQLFILTDDKKYVGLTYDNKCIVKGVQYKTIGLEKYWHNILSNFTLPYIQKQITNYFTTSDLSLFAIPVNDKYKFILKDNDVVEVANYTGLLLDIDRQFYFSQHMLPFIRAILEDTPKK